MPAKIATQIDSLQLLERLESFYNNAWGKLVVFVTITIAIAGIFIPLFLQWIQRRSLKLDAEKLRIDLENNIKESIASTKNEIIKMFQMKSKELENELDNKIKGLEGEASRLHATDHENAEDWESSAIWWSRAIRDYNIAGEDELLSVAVNGLKRTIEKCTEIDKVYKEEIKSYLPLIPKILWLDRDNIERDLKKIKEK